MKKNKIYSKPMMNECVGRIRMSILAGSNQNPDPDNARIKTKLDDEMRWEDNGARERRSTLSF
ncbi:MAG: hypothetical protein IKQ72_07610 [Bacteroidaceae bacterium]|nr:hypothetical protein [Bacteroidaceae bacterium]